MPRASRSLRFLETTLWILGIALLGVALVATFRRWSYQSQQERALFERGPAVSVAAPPAVTPATEVVTALPSPSATQSAAAPIKKAATAPRKRTVREPAISPSAFGRIDIPRLGVAAMVKEGSDDDTLEKAVGLVPGSARPGEGGNIVLAGHRDTFFRPLRRIKVNDRIRVLVPPHTYEYEVRSLRVVTPQETDVLASKGVEELTLVTCYPFRMTGPAPDRFIVSAARVN